MLETGISKALRESRPRKTSPMRPTLSERQPKGSFSRAPAAVQHCVNAALYRTLLSRATSTAHLFPITSKTTLWKCRWLPLFWHFIGSNLEPRPVGGEIRLYYGARLTRDLTCEYSSFWRAWEISLAVSKGVILKPDRGRTLLKSDIAAYKTWS